MKITIFLAILFSSVTNCVAQLPDIFANTPKQILATETIAEFPVNTFLENIAVDKKTKVVKLKLCNDLFHKQNYLN
jgi:hypothetical protein